MYQGDAKRAPLESESRRTVKVMATGRDRGNWEGRTQSNDEPFAEMPLVRAGSAEPEVIPTALVALLGFVAVLAALVIPNVIALLRG
jgi:hypothetical protein